MGMKVVIPAAGIGTRLRPLTYTFPKTLIYVAGRPILGHILHSVPSDLGELIIVVGYMGDRVREYVDLHFPRPKKYVVQEERLGLGHAVWLALKDVGDEEVLILLGDTIIEADLAAVTSSPVSTIGVRQVENPQDFGVVELRRGRIKRIVEKPSEPPSNLIIAGIYYVKNGRLLYDSLQELITSGTTTRGEYQLTDGLQRMVERDVPMGVFDVGVWLDCGTARTLLDTNRYLLKKHRTKTQPPGSIIIPPVHLAQTATVKRSVIGPYVSIAENVHISGSIVKDSIVNENAQLKDACIRRSIVGPNSIVKGAAAQLNLGDSSEIVLK